jgi:outer membrane protein assembly factor BamE (lipoprotein component of BamABCDE complex)
VVRLLGILLGCFCLTACAIQRAQVAADAQNKMIGMSKEQVFACMGPPATKATEGGTEVWSYASGNGQTDAVVSGGRGFAVGVSAQRYCTVNVTMVGGRVSRMNYVGPTGGLLTPGEQCAFALQNCTQ